MRIEVVVKYRNGLAVVDNGAPGPVLRQIPWDAGDAETEAQALAIGQSVLEQKVGGRSYEPDVVTSPYWPSIGDGVTTVDMDGATPVTSRVTTRRVTIRDGGYALSQPTLGSPSEELLARQQIALKRQSNSSQSQGTTPLAGQLGGSIISGSMSGPSITEWSFDPIGAVWGNIVEATVDAVIPKVMFKFDQTTKDPTSTSTNSATSLASPIKVGFVITPGRTGSFEQVVIPGGVQEWAFVGGLMLFKGDKIQPVLMDIYANDIADLEFKKVTISLQTAPGLMVRRDPAETNPTR
ncbi:MAG: hypothetical protein ACOYOQ_00325 [Microthrixaceae bacterium]